jgi:hypothetical protein
MAEPKIRTLHDAVAELIHDGDTVAMEGFTHLIPFAAAHEVIRQGITDLTLVRMTPDVIYDQLIGAGLVKKLVFSWGGNPGVGSLHRFRDAVENGWPRPLEVDEHSAATAAARSPAVPTPSPPSPAPSPARSWLPSPPSIPMSPSSMPSRRTARAMCSYGVSPVCRRRRRSPPTGSW